MTCGLEDHDEGGGEADEPSRDVLKVKIDMLLDDRVYGMRVYRDNIDLCYAKNPIAVPEFWLESRSRNFSRTSGPNSLGPIQYMDSGIR